MIINNLRSVNTIFRQKSTFDHLRVASIKQFETFEHWSRRLINDFFTSDFGLDYLDSMVSDNQPLVKTEIKRRIRERKKENPGKYPRDIDAILLEDIEYFFTRDDLYKKYFKKVFCPFYSGSNEIRSILERLIPIRNKLAHDNPISFREAEQVECYTNDFIDAFKRYYSQQGKEREYNVPTIISISDSQGNRVFREDSQHLWSIISLSSQQRERNPDVLSNALVTNLRSGDYYELQIEIDESFPEDSYIIDWKITLNYRTIFSGHNKNIRITITDKMVSYRPVIYIKLITNKNWHKYASLDCDDQAEIHLCEVLPPIADTY